MEEAELQKPLKLLDQLADALESLPDEHLTVEQRTLLIALQVRTQAMCNAMIALRDDLRGIVNAVMGDPPGAARPVGHAARHGDDAAEGPVLAGPGGIGVLLDVHGRLDWPERREFPRRALEWRAKFIGA